MRAYTKETQGSQPTPLNPRSRSPRFARAAALVRRERRQHAGPAAPRGCRRSNGCCCRRRSLVDTHSISDPLRNIWVLNRQVENDDDLLALHHIADVAIETDAAVYLQGSVVNQLILLRPEAL